MVPTYTLSNHTRVPTRADLTRIRLGRRTRTDSLRPLSSPPPNLPPHRTPLSCLRHSLRHRHRRLHLLLLRLHPHPRHLRPRLPPIRPHGVHTHTASSLLSVVLVAPPPAPSLRHRQRPRSRQPPEIRCPRLRRFAPQRAQPRGWKLDGQPRAPRCQCARHQR